MKTERSIDERKAQDLLNFQDLSLFGIMYRRRHLIRLIEEGRFPRPIKLGEKRIAFVRDHILAWIEVRKGERVEYTTRG